MQPLTPLEALHVEGQLSLRALRCCRAAGLQTVRDVALYHHNDPRYLTLAGCGKLTRRELNGLVKQAYGRLALRKAELEGTSSQPVAEPSWQQRWEQAEADVQQAFIPDSVAQEWEADGTLTASERNYARQCAEYAEFIIGSHGIPSSPADIRLHQWYLRQRSAMSTLGERRLALLNELLAMLHACTSGE